MSKYPRSIENLGITSDDLDLARKNNSSETRLTSDFELNELYRDETLREIAKIYSIDYDAAVDCAFSAKAYMPKDTSTKPLPLDLNAILSGDIAYPSIAHCLVESEIKERGSKSDTSRIVTQRALQEAEFELGVRFSHANDGMERLFDAVKAGKHISVDMLQKIYKVRCGDATIGECIEVITAFPDVISIELGRTLCFPNVGTYQKSSKSFASALSEVRDNDVLVEQYEPSERVGKYSRYSIDQENSVAVVKEHVATITNEKGIPIEIVKKTTLVLSDTQKGMPFTIRDQDGQVRARCQAIPVYVSYYARVHDYKERKNANHLSAKIELEDNIRVPLEFLGAYESGQNSVRLNNFPFTK